MALQLKYELRQFHIDAQGTEVHVSGNVLVTTYDDQTGAMLAQDAKSPDYVWQQLSPAMKSQIIALRDSLITALKTKYGTTAVTMISPQTLSG